MTRSTKWFLGIIGALAFVTLAFVGIIVWGISSAVSSADGGTETIVTGSGSKIAVVELKGVIVGSDDVVRQLKKYSENSAIRAIVLRIDSPGGGVVPSQEIYEQVRLVRESGKPVVVSMGSLAASGGYYVACGGSRLVANRGTLTGSIGVISEFLTYGDALRKLGVDMRTIKSGRLKDSGNPMRKMTDEEVRYFQSLMDDVHRQFIDVVEEERGIDHAQLLQLADGRVFTGEEAADLGLVDTIGTYEDAIAIAAGMAGISGEPSIVKERKRSSWYDMFAGEADQAVKQIKQELLDRPVLSYRYAGPSN